MVTHDQLKAFIKRKFQEDNGDDRIGYLGYAYEINSQSREYLDTGDSRKRSIGGVIFIIIKETGDVYEFGSFMGEFFDKLYAAKTYEEFQACLKDIAVKYPDVAVPAETLS